MGKAEPGRRKPGYRVLRCKREVPQKMPLRILKGDKRKKSFGAPNAWIQGAGFGPPRRKKPTERKRGDCGGREKLLLGNGRRTISKVVEVQDETLRGGTRKDHE